MAHGGGHERETLGKFVRTQSGYGTTVTNAKTSQHKSTTYIKHIVCKGDTLMALSLKYHVTVEALKRENKLWTNDMLFLREHILVPVTPDNQDMADPDLVVTLSQRDRSSSSVSNGSSHSLPDKNSGVGALAGDSGEVEEGVGGGAGEQGKGDKKENPLDILNKYDSNIAKLKSDVAKMKTNAESLRKLLREEKLKQWQRDKEEAERYWSQSEWSRRQARIWKFPLTYSNSPGSPPSNM